MYCIWQPTQSTISLQESVKMRPGVNKPSFNFLEVPAGILKGAVFCVSWFKSQKEKKRKTKEVSSCKDSVSCSCILFFVHVIWQYLTMIASPLLLLQQNPATFRICLLSVHVCKEIGCKTNFWSQRLRMLGAFFVPTKHLWVNQGWNQTLKRDLCSETVRCLLTS